VKTKIIAFMVASALIGLPLVGSALQQGIAISYGNDWLYQSNPKDVSGFNVAYTLQPDSWAWKNFTLGLNFSYGYWHTGQSGVSNTNISTYGIAPVIRWYFLQSQKVAPFLQGSVGGAYLSNSYFGGRNLGSRLEFQDMGGIGIAFGAKRQFYATLQSLHYSNANISSHNSGFSVPCLMTLGYNF
jgi:Lipid A 3-O-deacylase (PagL)